MSSEQLTFVATLTINDGATEAFLDMAEQCCEVVATSEPGNLTYDFYLDGNVCRAIEAYEDSAALLDHVTGRVGTELMPQLLAHASLDGILCFGEPTPEARAVIEQFGATIHGRPVRGRDTVGTTA